MGLFRSTPDVTQEDDPAYFNANPTREPDQTFDKLIVWLISADDIPGELFSNSDPVVTVTAKGTTTPGSNTLGLDRMQFQALKNVKTVKEWNRKTMVMFPRGSAQTFVLEIHDKDAVSAKKPELLLLFTAPLPTLGAGYYEYRASFFKGSGSIVFRVKHLAAERMIVSARDVTAYEMKHSVMKGLEGAADEEGAVISYHTEPSCTKAVLWLPGRCDSFYHPHVGKVFAANGFDLYVLSYRRNGVCRKFGLLKNPYLVSHNQSGLFSEYDDEITRALAFMQTNAAELGKTYAQRVGYGFSTGGPILIDYLRRNGDSQFDAFILNSPFLDWGGMSGVEETYLKFAAPALFAAGIYSIQDPVAPTWKPKQPSRFGIQIASQYELDPLCRPMYDTVVSLGFVLAADRFHKELVARTTAITSKPILLLTSKGDVVLDYDEILSNVKKVGPNVEHHLFSANTHDNFATWDASDNESSLQVLRSWLKNQGLSQGGNINVHPTTRKGFFAGCMCDGM